MEKIQIALFIYSYEVKYCIWFFSMANDYSCTILSYSPIKINFIDNGKEYSDMYIEQYKWAISYYH